MRKVIVAALALSPMLLHAQANSPASTDSTKGPVLQSKLDPPRSFNAAASPDRTAAAAGTPLRISTGVAEPKLIHTVDISWDNGLLAQQSAIEKTVVVEMTVDETGKPSDLKVVKSSDPSMNRSVLTAVSQYRFKPGTVSGQPTAVPVTLEITVRNPLS